MNKLLLILLGIIFSQLTLTAQDVFISKEGKVTFFSSAPLEDIEAINLNPNSILNTSSREIAFIIPIRSFRFQKKLMEEHFNEKYMESDKFPQALYKGKIIEEIKWKTDGKYDVSSEGIISIHGVDKKIVLPGIIHIDGKNIRLESAFNLAVADYNISIPSLLFQNIADTVQVKVDVSYKVFEKK